MIMEILEKRSRLRGVQRALTRHKEQLAAVTTLTLSNVFYLLERNKQSLPEGVKLLKTYQILSVTIEDSNWAFENYHENDFEDALQVAAGIRENCDVFITLDSKLEQKYRKHLNIELIV